MKKTYTFFALSFLFLTAESSGQVIDKDSSLVWQDLFEKSPSYNLMVNQPFHIATLTGQEKYIKIAEITNPEQTSESALSEVEENLDQPTQIEHDKTVEENDFLNSAKFALTLNYFIDLVREKNERIIAQELEFEISKEAIKSARSIFEPEAVASYGHQESEKKYTDEEKVRLFTNEDKRMDRANNYNAGVESLIPTGARINLGYAMSDFTNRQNTDDGGENQTDLVAEVTQPLLKNAGIKTTMANINMAEADSFISFQSYRQQMMQVLYESASAYWDLSLAQEKHKISVSSVAIAEEILLDSRERLKLGKMAETDVLEAEAGLANRKSLEIAARYDVNAAINYLRNFIASSALEPDQEIRTETELIDEDRYVDLHSSVEFAMENRPDFLSALKKLEREDIRVAYSKNQRWPQLDLKGSYGLNGLNDTAQKSFDDALDANDNTWYMGLELRIPLGGGQKTRSELVAAKHKKRQALLELKALETALKNAVHTSVGNVKSSSEQQTNYKQVAELNKRLLDVEMVRLDQGKSSNQDVLEKEENYHQAQNAYLDSLVESIKSKLELELIEGTLLQRFSAEIAEAN